MARRIVHRFLPRGQQGDDAFASSPKVLPPLLSDRDVHARNLPREHAKLTLPCTSCPEVWRYEVDGASYHLAS